MIVVVDVGVEHHIATVSDSHGVILEMDGDRMMEFETRGSVVVSNAFESPRITLFPEHMVLLEQSSGKLDRMMKTDASVAVISARIIEHALPGRIVHVDTFGVRKIEFHIT